MAQHVYSHFILGDRREVPKQSKTETLQSKHQTLYLQVKHLGLVAILSELQQACAALQVQLCYLQHV